MTQVFVLHKAFSEDREFIENFLHASHATSFLNEHWHACTGPGAYLEGNNKDFSSCQSGSKLIACIILYMKHSFDLVLLHIGLTF